MYLGIYFLSYITKTGANAYLETDGKTGFKGLFSSINEYSAIIIGILPCVVSHLTKKKKYIVLLTIFLLTLFSSILIGTKIILGGLIFNIGYFGYLERNKIYFDRTKKEKIIIIVSILVIAITSCFLFTKSRTYQNMKIQQSFFEVKNIISYDYLNRVVYNDRLTFLRDNYDYFKSSNLINKVFGIGVLNDDVKLVEIDIFDILFRYGIIGLLVFLYTTLKFINIKKIDNCEKISLVLLIIISLTSGHVLIYPAVAIYIGVILSNNNKVGDKHESSNVNCSL